MDSKLKERMIGAVVLVALGVWLIPVVFDGSDRAADDEAAVADTELLPAGASAPVRTEVVELDAANQAPRADVPAPAATELPVPDADSEAGAAPEVVAAAPVTAPPPADEDAPPVTTAAAVTAPEPEPEPEPAAAAPDGWSVQLGSFGEPANARQLAGRVADFGFTAHVSDYRYDGRTMHRVRVGGFASRDQAEAAASSLSAHGFVPRVFPPSE